MQCPFDKKNQQGSVCLSSLTEGQSGQVVAIDPKGQFTRRLLELGFVPGTVVEIRRRAPLQDPVEIELRGARICLRHTEVCQIAVRPLVKAAVAI
ncbi:MAG: ferrous iron transport protein A [Myxococcales bacterium]|nr:ferrous iron transport protein A [Myxococcales bacterium]